MDIQVLSIQAGDTLVVRTESVLAKSDIETMKENIYTALERRDFKIMIIGAGVRLSVIRAAA